MRRLLTLAALAAASLVLAPHATLAQKKGKEPKRPSFPIGVDTNEAATYYQYGLQQLQRDPDKAADAFYWAARLNPMLAEAYYARRCALLMSDKYRLQKYLTGDRRTAQSDEVKQADSLYFYALTLNPFVSRTLDGRMIDYYLQNWAEDYSRRNQVSPTEVRYYLNQMMRDSPPYFLAEQAYGEGDFERALSLYAVAIRQAKYKAGIRADRGRLFAQMGKSDSALAELTVAVDEMRKADKKDVVYFYESKALLEQSVGLLHERLGNKQAAKDAFGRALTEDLSYFPAHVQLGFLALDAADTATALNEMETAVQLRDTDPMLHYLYGHSLLIAGRVKDAEPQLRKAAELDPVFAIPHHSLARSLELQGRAAEAAAEYRAFLALSGKSDGRRADAEERAAKLVASGS